MSQDGPYRSATYRPTWTEMEKARREKVQRKRDEKKKTKAERQMKTVWNIDNDICEELELEFK